MFFINPKAPETKDLTREQKQTLIAHELLNVEYVLYLPPTMWSPPNFTLNGMDMSTLFALNGKIRNEIRSLGIETDLGDEHFLLLRAAGYQGREGVAEFKQKSMQAILSCNYDFVRELYAKVNERSRAIANGR